MERLRREECIQNAAKWEAEKVILLASSQLEQEKLQLEHEEKVKQLEEQLRQGDAEVLTLSKEEQHLSETSDAEPRHNKKTCQSEDDTLEEILKNLALIEEDFEAKVS